MVSSKIQGFDEAFGSYQNEVCVIYGPAGSGKTTLMQLACLAAAQDGHKILFFDTENGFSAERLRQLAGNSAACLEKIFVIKVQNFQDQCKKVYELVKIAGNFRLIVLDTVGAHFRKEYKADVYGSQRELEKQMRILHEICRQIPVLIANQVYSTLDGSLKMIGSEQILRWCDRVIRLEKQPRTICQEKPIQKSAQFAIIEQGISLLSTQSTKA